MENLQSSLANTRYLPNFLYAFKERSMKIFIAFGYTPEDQWIKEKIFPLLEAFDVQIVTGEDIHGQVIVQQVPELIKSCDAMIAFITRSWATHPWVRDELVTATTNKIPAVEVRDATLQNLGGILDGRQRIEYNVDQKDDLLLKLARLLSIWRKKYDTRSLMILPSEILNDARPHIRQGTLICHYQFRDGNEESPRYQTKPFRLPEGLAIDIRNIPSRNALVQINLEGPGFSWSCGYVTFNFAIINLQKEH